MKRSFLLFSFILVVLPLIAQVHTSYLWHLQQPIYWPDQGVWDPYSYQDVWESHSLKTSGSNIYSDGLAHPLNDLFNIFSKADRVTVYQWGAKNSVQTLLGLSEAGAQVNYSGCLMENVNSLADAGQWGYSAGWNGNYQTARGWTTSGGFPRMDIVGFTYHHALSPLISDEVLHKQIQAHRYKYAQTFGTSPEYSQGYWPAECSFSTRIIQTLVEEGFEWSVVANSKLARTLSDYPLTFGTSGSNYDPPNQADRVPATGNNWWNGQIDGRGGAFAAPYCYQAHNAQYIDPETGTPYTMVVVPMADLLSYQNGYATMGTGEIDSHIAPFEDPAHPSIVLLAHDGDNAWGGGFDYYQNSVPNFANAAASQGYMPTTVQQFLNDHPVPSGDLVHVEDGSWVNAANDWGHPQFINWLWPQYTENHEFDPNGWTEDIRNFAVLTAGENHVLMAEHLEGSLDIADIVDPHAGSSLAERAWHHLLPGYTSGYMYYGQSLDMEVKQTIACNKAMEFADQVIDDNPGTDNTPPSVFIPQRYPYNPGGTGFGPNYGYQQFQNPSDFHVWTLAYDVNGLSSIVVKYRIDNDGQNPLGNHDNETYSGGAGVGSWTSVNMTERIFPVGNVTSASNIDFFVLPNQIANQYYAAITGLSETLVDYYVEATDGYGNIYRSPIQHVYVGESTPVGGGGGTDLVYWTPENPTADDVITITVESAPTSANLHWGVTEGGSSWTTPIVAYRPAGSTVFGGVGPAIESPFTGPDPENILTIEIGPFNDPSQEIEQVDFVIHYSDENWDNNDGADYHIPITEGSVENCVPVSGIFTTDVTANTVILHWNIPTGADGFRVRGKIAGSSNWKTINIMDPTQDQLNVGGLQSNTQYEWQVQAMCNLDAWTGAEWSPFDQFTTGCDPPSSLNTVDITNNSAVLTWNTVSGVDGYLIQGRREGSGWATLSIGSGGVSSKTVPGLDPATSYDWKILSVCELSSEFSQISSFTTLPAEATFKIEGSDGLNLKAYPNPFGNFTQIHFDNILNKEFKITLFDVSGRIVRSYGSVQTNGLQIEKGELAAGQYILELKGESIYYLNLIVE